MTSTAQTWNSHDAAGTKPRVLCVDDEPYVLEGLKDSLRRSFDVQVADDPVKALELLRSEPDTFAIVISDMRMPRLSGADFLREARVVAPNAVRMLLTGHADLESAVKAVNGARLFRYLTKPCESGELLRACAAALSQHRLQNAERQLLEQTLRGAVDALAEVLALTNPAAFGRAGRIKAFAAGLCAAAEVPNAWEVEVAALLAHIGAVTLPQLTAEKLYAGVALSPAEVEMVKRVPAVTHRLLSKIPRLEGVLEILNTYETAVPDDSDGAPSDAPIGALALRIAADYDRLEAEGTDRDIAVGLMRSRGVYDRRLLYAFIGTLGMAGATTSVHEITLAGLRVGMTLLDDIRNHSGGLLIARGQPVTEQLLERLANLPAGSVSEPLRVTHPAG